jgi:hypothetical protein
MSQSASSAVCVKLPTLSATTVRDVHRFIELRHTAKIDIRKPPDTFVDIRA